ncbi:MAG: DUF5686 family protein [Arachidicoccus sp.]|nr:DUF5686 family protein [Arachidicoccus sp.]
MKISKILLGVILLITFKAGAQLIQLKGIITDSLTLLRLSSVTVYDNLLHREIIMNSLRSFSLSTPGKVDLRLSFVGYKTKFFKAQITRDTTINFLLSPADDQLKEVVITAKKKKYSNKHNPAVALIRQVILHKPENSINYFGSAQYEQYAKVNFYVEKFPKWAGKSTILKRYDFVLGRQDSLVMPGKKLMPIYMEETVAERYFRKAPHAVGDKLIAEKQVDYGKFIDTKGISALFNRLFEDVNIYDNDILIFTKGIASPISDFGPTWYKYFIADTITTGNGKLIKLRFEPRNINDLLFSGVLYVSTDGHYAIDSIELKTGKDINLGFLRQFNIQQRFSVDSATKHYYLSYSNITGDFGLYKNVTGLVGRKTIGITGFKSNPIIADSLLQTKDDILLRQDNNRPDDYWIEHRSIPLQKGETDIYKRIDSLRNMKSFQRTMDWVNTFASGYKTFNKFQIGPINSFIDYNPVEGFKPRVGGRTLPELNKSIYFSGYVAYGTRDRDAKYMGKMTYSFDHKSIYSYPVNAISITSSFDTNIPGTPDDNEHGNILFATNNGTFNRYLYNHIFKIDYLKEFKNHISLTGGFKIKSQRPGGSLQFIKNTYSVNDSLLNSIRTTELYFGFRWAPQEKFYQTGTDRLIIPGKYPIFTFDYTRGIKGLLAGKYNYDRFHLNVRKRIYLSILGVSHASIDAGYIVGKLPWPLLTIHQGNQGFGYSNASFNTMNYMEFVSDHYASLSLQHNFNGLFFNRIPLIKKLKWRELIGGKILFGGVRQENNPLYEKNLLRLPYATNAQTYFLSPGKPYIELNFGVANIFKIGEVNIIKRMTYLDHPGINKWNIKVGFNLEL